MSQSKKPNPRGDEAVRGSVMPSGDLRSRRRRSVSGLLTAALAVCSLLLQACSPTQQGEPVAYESTLSPAQATNGGTSRTAPVFSMAGRTDYSNNLAEAEALTAKFTAMSKDGRIARYVSLNPAGKLHVAALLAILAREKSELARLKTMTSDDSSTLSEVNLKAATRMEELNRHFLQGQPLGHSIQLKDPTTGRMTMYDGRFSARTEWTRIEKALSELPAVAESGSYEANAVKVGELAGVSVETDFSQVDQHCPGFSSSHDVSTVLSVFCPGRLDTIFLNKGATGWNSSVSSRYLPDTIRYEIAYSRFVQICGTSSPAVAGPNSVSAARSYAVLFLGASADSVEKSSNPGDRSSGDAAARKIHEGVCK